MPPGELVKAALEYATLGWSVFPCNANKAPHTAHGLKDASTDADQIRTWWKLWPSAMIGLATGRVSGVVVLDVDLDPSKCIDGSASLARLMENDKLPDDQMAVRTPRGGQHFYFAVPRDVRIGSSAGKLGPGLDIRAEGGYVIAPPSVNGTGSAYSWEPWGALYPLPDWLLERLRSKDSPPRLPYMPPMSNGGEDRAPAYGDAALVAECNLVASAPEGTRNDQLFRSAAALFELVAGGVLSEQRVRDLLLNTALVAGLSASESAKSIDSAAAHGLLNPRGPREPPSRNQKYTDWGTAEPLPGGDPGLQGLGREDGEEQSRRNPFKFCLYRDFRIDAMKLWTVDDYLGTDEISVHFGEPGSGKSVFVEDIALNLAAQRVWQGRRTRGGLTVYFALERCKVVERRAEAFRITTGLDDLPFVAVPGPIDFKDWKTTPQRVLDTVHRAEDVYGIGMAMLAIDTVSQGLSAATRTVRRTWARSSTRCAIFRARRAAT